MSVRAVLATVVTVAAHSTATAQPSAPAMDRQAAPVAITNVTVIDVAGGRRVPGQTVVISGSRIRAVGRRVTVPAGARVVDGRGRFLIPGLWDMHVHSAAAVEREFPL